MHTNPPVDATHINQKVESLNKLNKNKRLFPHTNILVEKTDSPQRNSLPSPAESLPVTEEPLPLTMDHLPLSKDSVPLTTYW